MVAKHAAKMPPLQPEPLQGFGGSCDCGTVLTEEVAIVDPKTRQGFCAECAPLDILYDAVHQVDCGLSMDTRLEGKLQLTRDNFRCFSRGEGGRWRIRYTPEENRELKRQVNAMTPEKAVQNYLDRIKKHPEDDMSDGTPRPRTRSEGIGNPSGFRQEHVTEDPNMRDEGRLHDGSGAPTACSAQPNPPPP